MLGCFYISRHVMSHNCDNIVIRLSSASVRGLSTGVFSTAS